VTLAAVAASADQTDEIGARDADALSVTPPFDVVVDTMPTILSVVRATGTTLRPGMPIVWTANVAGGLAPLE
jgi:hypothetical protein